VAEDWIVADIRFDTAFAFKATDGTANRTMALRLNDIINVKDWGATGDGITDDSAAIQAALDYAIQNGVSYLLSKVHGAVLFFPAGTYIIGTPIYLCGLNVPELFAYPDPRYIKPYHESSNLKIMGAGRDATILKGNFANDGVLKRVSPYNDALEVDGYSVQDIMHMTIWNQSLTSGSCCIRLPSAAAVGLRLDNLKLRGLNGLDIRHDNYNMLIANCIAECVAPIGAANSASPGPVAGSRGFCAGQGQTVNCQAIGFDVGFAVGGGAIFYNGNRAYRCNVGFDLGGPSVPPSGGGGGTTVRYLNFAANITDRCKWGLRIYSVFNACIAANVIKGTSGPCDPIPITSISCRGTTATVTSVGHNLAAGTTKLALVTNPIGWTPDGTGKQIVTCTRVDADTFTYSLPSGNPASFTSATWNYPIEYAIVNRDAGNVTMLSNVTPAMASVASIDITNLNNGQQILNFAAAMSAPYGFAFSLGGFAGNANWRFVMCGTPNVGTNPLSFLLMNAISTNPSPSAGIYTEGTERNIIDAQRASFGQAVTGGGNNHYKVRCATNDGSTGPWTRVG
jgi:hypothetical protein